MKNVFRNLGWLLGSRGINAVLSLVYLALATRTLGVAGFGQFAMILVFAQGIAGIASFNTWQAVVKWGHADGDSAAVTGFAVALDIVSIASGLLLAALASATAAMWLPLPADSAGLTFALCAAALLGIRSTPTGILRLNDRYDLSTLAEAALPATRAVGAIIAASVAPTLAGFIAAWAFAELVCAGTYWFLASRFVSLRPANISLRRFPARADGVWQFMLATSLSRTAAVVAKQVLLLGVGAFGGAALAGGYRVASQLGQALVQLGEAVSRAIYPEFVKRAHASTLVAKRMVMLALLTGLVAALVAGIGGNAAISLIAGREFLFAYPALVVLSLAGALDLSGATWDALLVSRKRAGTALIARVVPLAAALAAMPWAISVWGLIGVAGSLLVASALTLAALSYAVKSAPDEAAPASRSIA